MGSMEEKGSDIPIGSIQKKVSEMESTQKKLSGSVGIPIDLSQRNKQLTHPHVDVKASGHSVSYLRAVVQHEKELATANLSVKERIKALKEKEEHVKNAGGTIGGLAIPQTCPKKVWASEQKLKAGSNNGIPKKQLKVRSSKVDASKQSLLGTSSVGMSDRQVMAGQATGSGHIPNIGSAGSNPHIPEIGNSALRKGSGSQGLGVRVLTHACNNTTHPNGGPPNRVLNVNAQHDKQAEDDRENHEEYPENYSSVATGIQGPTSQGRGGPISFKEVATPVSGFKKNEMDLIGGGLDVEHEQYLREQDRLEKLRRQQDGTENTLKQDNTSNFVGAGRLKSNDHLKSGMGGLKSEMQSDFQTEQTTVGEGVQGVVPPGGAPPGVVPPGPAGERISNISNHSSRNNCSQKNSLRKSNPQQDFTDANGNIRSSQWEKGSLHDPWEDTQLYYDEIRKTIHAQDEENVLRKIAGDKPYQMIATKDGLEAAHMADEVTAMMTASFKPKEDKPNSFLNEMGSGLEGDWW